MKIKFKDLEPGDIYKVIDIPFIENELFIVINNNEYHLPPAGIIKYVLRLSTGEINRVDIQYWDLFTVEVVKKVKRDFSCIKISSNSALYIVKIIKEAMNLGLKEAKDYFDENHIKDNDKYIIDFPISLSNIYKIIAEERITILSLT